MVIPSHVPKKNCYSHHPFVFNYLISICIYYLFEFKYFNYLYKKKKNKITSSKKKPHYLTQKLLILTPNFLWSFFFKSLKHSKIFVIQILYKNHKSPSIHTNVYHLSFVQISIFFYLS